MGFPEHLVEGDGAALWDVVLSSLPVNAPQISSLDKMAEKHFDSGISLLGPLMTISLILVKFLSVLKPGSQPEIQMDGKIQK